MSQQSSKEREIAAILNNAIIGLNRVAETIGIAMLPDMLTIPSSDGGVEGISIKQVAYWKIKGNINAMENIEVQIELSNGRFLKVREPKESAVAVASYLLAAGMPEEEEEGGA